jgi:hypothetical protein
MRRRRTGEPSLLWTQANRPRSASGDDAEMEAEAVDAKGLREVGSTGEGQGKAELTLIGSFIT